MLFCAKCGDYYADGSSAFCLADGTPLISVDASSERWSDGSRIIEQKEHALRKQKRRQRWWRVSSVMTMLVVTMVVYGVVAKKYVYLIPAASLSPTPSSSPPPSTSSSISATPLPTIVIEKTATPTIVVKETPTPTIVVKDSPTPTVVVKDSATPAECSADDQAAGKKIIVPMVAALLRPELAAAQGPAGAKNVDGILRAVNYEVSFSKTCQRATVAPSLRIPGLAVPKLRQFECRRTPDGWSCS